MIRKENFNMLSLNLEAVVDAEINRKVKGRFITLCETPQFI